MVVIGFGKALDTSAQKTEVDHTTPALVADSSSGGGLDCYTENQAALYFDWIQRIHGYVVFPYCVVAPLKDAVVVP